ncbi:DNA phosphorothioation-associated protein 4 [Pontibacillus salipaludis]|uniref:DNA phosphorothioation-associated protein 4 n=1 Tax=Pontibacillus salipaludis TaxID=1697394 RepID=A0ABQ1Q0G8_9BACI|nr:DNA phosphorothioation-associated protein 4 [Pontibacillus salipaludis]GGD08297.1 hypothetical protein GCM10011389_14830 [Pontibacillus salipaludis]
MYNRRVRRPKQQEHIYTELTDKNEFGIFETYKDLFMLSLTVGYLEGERIPFKESLELINWQVFSERTDEPVINMIAYLETEDLSLLYDSTEEKFEEKITIAEEYAASGAEKVYNIIMEDEKNGLRNVIDYIEELHDITDHSELERRRLTQDLI